MKENQNLTRREMREKILKDSSNQGVGFRRGKTISGHKSEQSERSKNHKLVIRRRKLGVFLVSLVIFSILVSIFLLQFIANVEVSSSGLAKNNFEKYRKTIDKYLSVNPSERILSNLNRDSLLNFLQKENPEVLKISDINLKGLSSFNFNIDFRKPVASWHVDGKEFYVDSEGVSFSDNLFEKPNLSIVDDSGVIASSGVNVAGSGFFGFVGKLVSSANSRGLEIVKIRIPPLSLRQIEVSVRGVKYFAKMSTVDSAEGQLSNFKTAIDYFNSHKISPSYIDLRIEGKGYYK